LPPPPPMATSLQFTAQPQSAQTGGSLGTFTVAAVDSAGTVVTDFNGTVTLAIGTNPGGGTLSGTASVALGNGVATFSGLSIDKAGNGYTLTASTSGLKSAASSPFNVTTPPPTTGSLTVTTATTGSNLPTSGYTISLDGGSGQAIGINGSLTLNNLTAGSHTVTISGLASNCTVGGGTSQAVTVPAGGSTSASFAITCVAPPPTNHPPVVNAGGNQSAVEAVLYQLNASFTDVDGDGPWTYDVNWGDGTSSSGTLSAQGAIGPSHTYVLPSDYTITVTVTDAHGASGADSKTLHVTL
ncbi:MAG TPA: PKD domain-containing protein, partial [Gemmatimonadales bacterium]|nr:PKD domain-containing protein [Gemmatimonadales bacterium]